ncbi:MAG: RNA polymerase sigma factor [Candidatus Methylacidiphilales bacterium]|nr:RNA polymerase sigma factor [Candidatus Methylacidiphilales bacterium]
MNDNNHAPGKDPEERNTRNAADIAAMERLRDGDTLALNEIMQRWKEPLARFLCRQLGGSEHDALDIAQETFVRVYEQRQRYRPQGKFSVWLFEIACNLCRNKIRWRIRHPTVSLDSESDDWMEKAKDPRPAGHEILIQQERAEAVRAAVVSLPEDLRTAFLLLQYEEMSYLEISAILHCTPKAVETRVYRARRHLEDQLRAWL